MHHADTDDSKSKHPLIHPSIPSSLNSVVDPATETVPLKVLPLISSFEIILGLISLVETHVCADKPPMRKCLTQQYLLYRYRGHLFLSSDKLCRNWQDQSSSIPSSSPLPWHLQTHNKNQLVSTHINLFTFQEMLQPLHRTVPQHQYSATTLIIFHDLYCIF